MKIRKPVDTGFHNLELITHYILKFFRRKVVKSYRIPGCYALLLFKTERLLKRLVHE